MAFDKSALVDDDFGIVDAYKRDIVKPRATSNMSGTQRLLAGIGRGMLQLPRGIGQLAGVYSQQEIDEMKHQDEDLLATPQGGLGDFTGQIATGLALPVKAPLISNPIANRAAVGGVYGALMPTSSDESRVFNTVASAAAGAALPSMMQATGKAIKSGVNKVAPKVANAVKGTVSTVQNKASSMIDDAVNKYPVLGTQLTASPAPILSQEEALPNAMPNPQNPDAIKMAQLGAERLGLNWADLSDDVQRQMSATADEAMRLGASELTPEMLAKKALLEAQGFVATRADVTGSPQDYAARNSIMMQPEGAYLHEVARKNNQNLEQKILDVGSEESPLPVAEFGSKLRKGLESELDVSKNRISNLYSAAERQEGGIKTKGDDLAKALNDELAFAVSKQDSPVREFLRRIGKEKVFFPTENTLAAKNADKSLTMKELATLRQIVNSRWENVDNATQRSLDNLRGILNTMEKNPDIPAPIYREARVSRITQGKKWEQPALDRIFAQDKNTAGQYKIADEELLNKVFFSSSNKDFSDVWLRMNKQQKDLTRSQIAKEIRDFTFSNMQMTSGVNAQVVGSPAKLIKILDNIGDEKLGSIFGKDKAQKLKMLGSSWRELRSSPEGTRSFGSAPEIARMYRQLLNVLKVANHIPIVSKVTNGVTGMVERSAKADAEQIQRLGVANNDRDLLFSQREDFMKRTLQALNQSQQDKKAKLVKPAVAGTFSIADMIRAYENQPE